MISNAISRFEVDRLKGAVDRVSRDDPGDVRDGRPSPENAETFRYEMINRSEWVRQVTSDRRILDVIEPLLGGDGHLISSTAWRNPPELEHAPRGQEWHVDAGPFVPDAWHRRMAPKHGTEAWHRRLPPRAGGTGRYFLQTNDGRRDIAHRIKPTSKVRHVHPEVVAMGQTHRNRTVLGEHPQGLYDG